MSDIDDGLNSLIQVQEWDTEVLLGHGQLLDTAGVWVSWRLTDRAPRPYYFLTRRAAAELGTFEGDTR